MLPDSSVSWRQPDFPAVFLGICLKGYPPNQPPHAKTVDIRVPMVIRLAGTNAEEAAELLKSSGMNFEVADTLEDAAQKIISVLK